GSPARRRPAVCARDDRPSCGGETEDKLGRSACSSRQIALGCPFVFDWRVYRAATIPVVLALVVAAFSFGNLPAPLTSTLAPDAFDGAQAFGLLQGLAASYPHRRPGSSGDEALAGVTA